VLPANVHPHGARAVIRDDHDQRVLELADALQVGEQPPDVVIGVAQEPSEHLHHPRVQAPLIVAERLPRGNVRVVARQLRGLRDDAELLLAREHLLTVGVPTIVEGALVTVGPLTGNVVRRVHRTGTKMHIERLVGVDLLGVRDKLDRAVGQILGQVVALIGRFRRLDLMIVIDQVRVPLARVAAEEPVVTLKAAAERPAVIWACGRLLAAGYQMPLADHVGVVAVLQEHLRQKPVLERDKPVIARIARRHLGDTRHRIAVMVAAADDARAARRAQRRRMHVVVTQPPLRHTVQVRRRDRAAVTPELAEARVVKHNEQHVRRVLRRAHRRRPRRRRLIGGPADHTRK
jgi:hypothetical protein